MPLLLFNESETQTRDHFGRGIIGPDIFEDVRELAFSVSSKRIVAEP